MTTGTFDSVNFTLNSYALDFRGYEFEGELTYDDGEEHYTFRLDIDDETGEAVVYEAYSDSFDIGEDVTAFFDIDALKKAIVDYLVSHDVPNCGDEYAEYLAEGDED